MICTVSMPEISSKNQPQLVYRSEGQAGLAEDGSIAEELARELQDASGVGDDLHGFDAGDLIEEPAATGVHQLGVAFELEQFEDGDALLGRQGAGGVACEEAVFRRGGAVEDDVDVSVARGPEADQQRRGKLFREGRGGVAQIVERFAERASPLLVPARPAGAA